MDGRPETHTARGEFRGGNTAVVAAGTCASRCGAWRGAPPTPSPSAVAAFLERSSTGHRHACPRQVLGIRMALAAGSLLDLPLPREDKGVLAIAETDGCFLSGIEVAAGVSASRRTLRIVDLGRVAVTFAEVRTGRAWRLAPRPDVRERAVAAAPGASSRYDAMLQGYAVLPTEELLRIEEVDLVPHAGTLVSRPHVRVTCARCGEEVINERETLIGGLPVCPACAGGAYYRPTCYRPGAD